MADTQSSQPHPALTLDHLEASLERWRDHLSHISSTLGSSELQKLTREWDRLREDFEVASLYWNREVPALSAVMGGLPDTEKLSNAELELIIDALLLSKKNLRSMLDETKPRMALLEDVLNSDKPAKMKKSLDKMREVERSLQTRLLGLDAYVDLFQNAEHEGMTLSETARALVDKSIEVDQLTLGNHQLEEKAEEMQRWLTAARKNLDRLPPAPPPSPGAIQQISLSLGEGSEADKSLMGLFSTHEKLKDARAYLENYLSEKEGKHA